MTPDDARFLEETRKAYGDWNDSEGDIRRLLRIVEGLSKELLLSRAIVDAQKKNADRDEEVVHRLGGEVKALKSKLSDAEARIKEMDAKAGTLLKALRASYPTPLEDWADEADSLEKEMEAKRCHR